MFDQNGRYIVLACVARVSTQTDEIVFIDADGNVRFTKEFVGVRDVAAVGDECYVLADGTVYAFDIYGNEKSKTDVPDAYGIRADNSAVFCVRKKRFVSVKKSVTEQVSEIRFRQPHRRRQVLWMLQSAYASTLHWSR